MKLFNQEEIKHLSKVCGIYLIKVNEKEYVGSSVNIYKRFLTEAKNSLKINNIQRAIKNNLTAGGFRWRYK